MHNIGCVILSSSDDFMFLEAGIAQIAPIMRHVVIALGTKLWNGEAEDKNKCIEMKDKLGRLYTNVSCITYNVPDDKIQRLADCVSDEMYWEGHARYLATRVKKIQQCDYVMYLDSDEVVDGSELLSWLNTGVYLRYDAMKLRNYWYWRDVKFRAKNYYEDSVVLAKLSACDIRYLFHNMGRHGIYEMCKGSKARDLSGLNGPMIHHYSWVRTHEQMLRKVANWGHRNDRIDWSQLVNDEFAREFNGTDFLKSLSYDVVEDKFGFEQKMSQ